MAGIGELKDKCHKWFDKLWKNHEERDYYYHRLAEEMGIDYENCHFSMMTYEQLERALEIIKKFWWEKYDR